MFLKAYLTSLNGIDKQVEQESRFSPKLKEVSKFKENVVLPCLHGDKNMPHCQSLQVLTFPRILMRTMTPQLLFYGYHGGSYQRCREFLLWWHHCGYHGGFTPKA